jgi:hypothetical protein
MCSKTCMVQYFVLSSRYTSFLCFLLLPRSNPARRRWCHGLSDPHVPHVARLTGILAAELKPVLKGAMSKNGVIGPFMPAKQEVYFYW